MNTAPTVNIFLDRDKFKDTNVKYSHSAKVVWVSPDPIKLEFSFILKNHELKSIYLFLLTLICIRKNGEAFLGNTYKIIGDKPIEESPNSALWL